MKTTMTLKQFKDLSEGNKSLKTIRLENSLGGLFNSKKVLGLSTFVLGNLMYCEEVLATNVDLSKVDEAGGSLLYIVQTFGYWSCIILCIIEIIKCLASKDSSSVSRVITKYVIAFGAVHFMPWLFDIIKGLFA